MNFDDLPKSKQNVDYLRFEANGKLIYVMLNHRVAYLSWMDAYRKGVMKEGAFLIHIDKHLDFTIHHLTVLEEDRKIKVQQIQEHLDFVQQKSSSQNVDFIILAMDRGLIGDGISIDAEFDKVNIDYGARVENGDHETTKHIAVIDKNGRPHKFYSGYSSVIQLFGYQGLLTDRFTHQDLQIAYKKGTANRNIALDLDLDYFTYNEGDGQQAMNERHIDRILNSDAFIDFLTFSRVITIALEPYYCGDWEECKHILNRLNRSLKKHLDIDIEQQVIEAFKEDATL